MLAVFLPKVGVPGELERATSLCASCLPALVIWWWFGRATTAESKVTLAI